MTNTPSVSDARVALNTLSILVGLVTFLIPCIATFIYYKRLRESSRGRTATQPTACSVGVGDPQLLDESEDEGSSDDPMEGICNNRYVSWTERTRGVRLQQLII